jgi:ATP-binding cassette subfamily C (CFTR/MRP) protein 4
LTFIGLTIGGLTSRAAVHVLIMTQVWLANDTTAETIFFSLNCYYLLSDSLTTLLPLAVYKASELAAAIKRLEEFVENPHREQEISTKSCSSSKISLFGDNKKNEKLQNGLTVVTGPIGSGKTLLLITTLENLHEEDRNLVQKSVSYVPQDPWCFPSTVRQNILFGNKYEEKRYRTVLEVCDLLHDLELMENGDLTIIQNGGFNLSKDQQVKINLARGVYKKSDIYLIDDCLSCLDIQMSDFIFSECVLNFLKDKTVVLVSHNWEYLEQSNKLVNANNGSTVDMVNTYKFKNGDDTNGDKMFPGKLAKTKKKSTDVESKLLLENTTDTDVYHEVKKSGEVDVRIYQEYLKLAGGLPLFLTVFCVFVLTQIVTTSTDDLVTSW